tara:strand:- start:55 stop:585 length:531 start_codon:yes stop_codon:yes gene_type:complete
MKDINVINNFVNDEELQEIIDAIHNSSWKYSQCSDLASVGDIPKPGVKFWKAELIQEEETIGKKLLTKIEKLFDKKYKIQRLYANGQTFGQDGTFHQDDPSDNVYTLLIYISPITVENIEYIGGFTEFKRGDNIINVEPYKKRGIFFKSNLYHRGMAPCRLSDLLRVTVAMKVVEV